MESGLLPVRDSNCASVLAKFWFPVPESAKFAHRGING
jgi:hypothetical protein